MRFFPNEHCDLSALALNLAKLLEDPFTSQHGKFARSWSLHRSDPLLDKVEHMASFSTHKSVLSSFVVLQRSMSKKSTRQNWPSRFSRCLVCLWLFADYPMTSFVSQDFPSTWVGWTVQSLNADSNGLTFVHSESGCLIMLHVEVACGTYHPAISSSVHIPLFVCMVVSGVDDLKFVSAAFQSCHKSFRTMFLILLWLLVTWDARDAGAWAPD